MFLLKQQPPPRSAPLLRATALLAVAMVLMLSALAVSPLAHSHVHADAGGAEHTCAVTLYAQGVTTLVAAMLLAVVVWRLLQRAFSWREAFVAAPAFVHLPGRAPPTA